VDRQEQGILHATWIEGRRLHAVVRDDAAQQWNFDFGDGYVLQVTSPWRLLWSGRIALGHQDHGMQFGLPEPVDAERAALELVHDRPVRTAIIDGESADLRIDFGSGVQLEVFNDSSGFEGWTLNGPDRRVLVAQGGGTVVEWKGSP
jgi:hypothetical protein